MTAVSHTTSQWDKAAQKQAWLSRWLEVNNLARQMQWSSAVEATRPCDEDWPIDGDLVDFPDEGPRMTMNRLEEKLPCAMRCFWRSEGSGTWDH